MATWSHFSNEC